ncbi:hypothetical protein BJX68DRAFT_227391 [Aspergillus pseudodeflectus]|uniref:Uncharacterized protein n=1 Tax=Aspergillus pseudodeflectus TaxID=176178 RepID=A0ABR4L2U6_9EURO
MLFGIYIRFGYVINSMTISYPYIHGFTNLSNIPVWSVELELSSFFAFQWYLCFCFFLVSVFSIFGLSCSGESCSVL